MNDQRTAEMIAVPASIRAKLAALSLLSGESDWRIIENALAKLLADYSQEDRDFIQIVESKVLRRKHNSASENVLSQSRSLADEIRDFVSKNYVQPARLRGARKLTVEIREIHRQMGLTQRYAAIQAALRGKEF
ncbi:MAG: hypothetical protein LUO89_14850 [Methanothrix sp.]|nr:hypothetical protein [Methanothrix sp.]